jgi:hypothetical protein
VDAWSVGYDVYITDVSVSNCSDTGGAGIRDPFYLAYVDGELDGESPYVSTCPGADFSGYPLYLFPTGTTDIEIEIWEDDSPYANDYYGTICWAATTCTIIPRSVLHAGISETTINAGGGLTVDVTVEFWPY